MKTIWLVGASSGIGRALFNELDHHGRTLIISSRSGEDLAAMAANAQGRVIVVPLDIAEKPSVQRAITEIKKHCESIDALIVNAGTCEYINSVSIDTAAVDRVMATNFNGAVDVVNAALPLLRTDRVAGARRKIVMTASSVTYLPLPRAGAYGASKAALRYFAECLQLDLQHEDIDVQLISPGFVKTPLTDNNDFSMPFLMSAENAARRIVRGLNSRRFDIHFPRRLTWSLKMLACLPGPLQRWLIGQLSRHPHMATES